MIRLFILSLCAVGEKTSLWCGDHSIARENANRSECSSLPTRSPSIEGEGRYRLSGS